MTPERWQQVNELFHSALEREPNQRAIFLLQVCAGDEELRKEVESLIRSHKKDGSFIGTPALSLTDEALADDHTESAIGQSISHYKIIRTLGTGGMGKVYLAQDDLLSRKVAIKLLPSSLNYDKQLRARFIREAQLASGLEHPNICTIHEVGESAGRHFIVMQYVEGETLKQVIGERPLKLDSLLSISLQVADALAAAHSQGIIHRDIKSSNIIITPRGQAKVLDFGLAKLLEGTIGEGESELTRSGVMLGTPSYMSPEQARGERVDARSDLFSFGVVMYEMASGRVAFKGKSQAETMNAVINEPHRPVTELNKRVPPQLSSVIDRLLTKSSKDRYQTMREVQEQLRQVAQAVGLTSSSVQYIPRKPHRLPWRLGRAGSLIGLAVMMLVIGGILWSYFSRASSKSPPLPPMKVVPFTSFPDGAGAPAFSPDGNQIAFVWGGEKGNNTDIYTQLVDGGNPLRLTSDPAIDFYPCWSPDGRRVAFVRISGNKVEIFMVSALGGAERKLISLDEKSEWGYVTSLSWSLDGKYIVYSDRRSTNEPASLFLLSVESLEKQRLTFPPELSWGDIHAAFSRDGQSVAFARYSSRVAADIYIMPIAGGEARRLTFDDASISGFSWTEDGREIIFASTREGGTPTLWRVSGSGGSPERLSITGENAAGVCVSSQGHRLAYGQGFNPNSNVYRIDLLSSSGRNSSSTPLIYSTKHDNNPQISPDGKRIAFESDRTGGHEVWICDSDGSNPLQVTSSGGRNAGSPRWSPDGRQIAFDSVLKGDSDIYIIDAEGGNPRRLTNEISDEDVPSWSHDGQWIYFASNRSGGWQVWKMPAEGGAAVQVTRQGGALAFESPDGKFIYYSKFDGPGIWRVPVEGGQETAVVDSFNAGWGNWAVVDYGIYFIKLDSKAGAAIEFYNFETGQVNEVAALGKVEISILGVAVSPDRKWLLYTRVDPGNTGNITIVENFR